MQAIEADPAVMPPVPLTLEGASVLHQMMRIKWAAWKALPQAARAELVAEATAALSAMEQDKSAVFSKYPKPLLSGD